MKVQASFQLLHPVRNFPETAAALGFTLRVTDCVRLKEEEAEVGPCSPADSRQKL